MTTTGFFANEKRLMRLIYILSIVVFAVVIVLKMLPQAENMPAFVVYLPLINAILNGTCSVLLVFSFVAIKNKNIQLHKKLNVTAFVLSALFLVSYVLFHAFVEETTYPTDNPNRPLYLVILFSHIVLAAIVLPMVLISFYRGLNMDIPKHRKIVRWTFPIWLYVTVTGVIVYLMISPYYDFGPKTASGNVNAMEAAARQVNP